jgi:hypothetical protein
MKRRHALAGVPAALYAAACHAEQDNKPGTTPGASYPGRVAPPRDGGFIRITDRVRFAYRAGSLEVKPVIAVLMAARPGAARSSLRWDIDIPPDHTLEINYVIDYEGESHVILKKDVVAMRGPFAQVGNEVRGRYISRGPAIGVRALDSGPVDVQQESYWKYEVTIYGPDRKPIVVIDPGTIIKEGEG